jgi:uncharacterized protein
MDSRTHTILWRRLDVPGHEHARLALAPDRTPWQLSGAAVFTENGQPARLEYLVLGDARWHTLAGRIKGWIGDTAIDLAIDADGEGRWRINGHEVPEVVGCLDLDLSFSPSTNLLPIRRLDLAIGASADVRSAWLLIDPQPRLEALHQRYARVDERTYAYESPSQGFAGTIRVNDAGLVEHYSGLWAVESGVG